MRSPFLQVLFTAIPCLSLPAQWSQALPHVAPPSPRGSAIAFDTHRARAVRFGGCDIDYPQSAISGASAATWEWEGGEWLLRATASAPPARFFHAMAYDQARRRVVVFGGRSALGTTLGDTWEFDGWNWSDKTPVAGPSPIPREVTGLAYDAARQVCVLFGGGPFLGPAHYDDTWTWNGTAWTEQAPAHRPVSRFGHAMAYDSVHQRVLLFAGTVPGGFVDDLWQWDGSDWTELPAAATRPAPRHYHAMAYDPTRDELLVFGGNPGGYLPPIDDTWVYHAGSWTLRQSPQTPTRRQYAALCFDPVRREYVMYGGEDQLTGAQGNSTDTWTFGDADGWFGTFGSGCGGAHGVPTLIAPGNDLPSLGQPFALAVTQLPPLAICAMLVGIDIAGGSTLPRDLATIGFPGCTQWVESLDTRLLLGVAGQATMDFTVPGSPLFVGMHVYFQAAAWDSTAALPNLGLTTSNAGCATIGS